jgi:hypothetical protein
MTIEAQAQPGSCYAMIFTHAITDEENYVRGTRFTQGRWDF